MKQNKIPKDIFICIGAQKAGTTWLYNCLKEHPQVYLPLIKELNFFNEIEANKSTWKHRLFDSFWLNKKWRKVLIYCILNILIFRKIKDSLWVLKYIFLGRKIENIEKYIKLLLRTPKESAILTGDITPNYNSIKLKNIKKINASLPNIKLIFIMRNPVYRDWSAAKMILLKHRGKTMKHYDEKKFINFLGANVERSDYIGTIKNWTTYYPENQILFCFYDELKENPNIFFKKICNFLEIDILDDFSFTQKVYLKGLKAEIPTHLKSMLYRKHYEQLKELSILFKDSSEVNYPLQWLEDAKLYMNDE